MTHVFGPLKLAGFALMAVATSETDADEDAAEAEDRSMRRFLASYCAVRLVVTLEMIVGFQQRARAPQRVGAAAS